AKVGLQRTSPNNANSAIRAMRLLFMRVPPDVISADDSRHYQHRIASVNDAEVREPEYHFRPRLSTNCTDGLTDRLDTVFHINRLSFRRREILNQRFGGGL